MTSSNIAVGSRLFCTAAPDLAPGSLLAGGEFHRRWTQQVVNTPSQDVNNSWATVALLELSWETVRLRKFPEKSSRFDCLFLWENEDGARRFHSRRLWPTELYQVEITACSRVCRAEIDLISYLEENETTGFLMNRARLYWQGEPTSLTQDGPWEVLLEGTVKIVACLTEKQAAILL